ERDRSNVGMGQHGLADHRPRADHEVEYAGEDLRTRDDLSKRMRGAGDEFGGLEDEGVAVAKGRRDFPGRYCDREIPWRDQADDAERFARDLDFDAGTNRWSFLACQPKRL